MWMRVLAETSAVDQHWSPVNKPTTMKNEHKSLQEQAVARQKSEQATMVIPWNTLFFNLSTLLSIALWVIDFSWFPQISLVSFGRPWITALLKSIKLIHIRQYFVITDFDPFFKLTNRFLSSNIHFIDLSISFSMIDFDRFVTPCWNPAKVFCRTQNAECRQQNAQWLPEV